MNFPSKQQMQRCCQIKMCFCQIYTLKINNKNVYIKKIKILLTIKYKMLACIINIFTNKIRF